MHAGTPASSGVAPRLEVDVDHGRWGERDVGPRPHELDQPARVERCVDPEADDEQRSLAVEGLDPDAVGQNANPTVLGKV